jgi:hypothetical protein
MRLRPLSFRILESPPPVEIPLCCAEATLVLPPGELLRANPDLFLQVKRRDEMTKEDWHAFYNRVEAVDVRPVGANQFYVPAAFIKAARKEARHGS